jgi:membrane-bound lytic murein transglycosylase A
MLIQTSHPLTQEPFESLAIAQDKGAAIKGHRRVDFFWGFGEEAAQLAGHTKSRADMIILLPKDFKVVVD